MLKLRRFGAAAVQASPVYLNPSATVDKALSLVREAVANGAKLVAFREGNGAPRSTCASRQFPANRNDGSEVMRRHQPTGFGG